MLYRRTSFSRFARTVAHKSGHPAAFFIALMIIVGWALTGPLFHFSDTWQLVINTGTTIVTFLMVFLIQNTQNCDSYAMQLKLDELIRAVEGAHNSLLGIEELTEQELLKLKHGYAKLARRAIEDLRQGRADTDRPDYLPEFE